MPSPDRHFASGALFTETAAPGTPSANNVWIYPKTDGRFYGKDDTGTEFNIGTIIGSCGTTDNVVPRADGTGGSTIQDSKIVIDDEDSTTQTNVAIRNIGSFSKSSIVITPNGDGAFILGKKPDGTSTGGGGRGQYAVDLQMVRTTSSQTAVGNHSFIGGGQNNAAASNNSVCCGGKTNSSATNAAVCGGEENNAGADATFIGGGYGNEASQVYGGILCGLQALADRNSMQAHAAGQFSAKGDAQRARFVLRNKTTTNAAVELFLDGSAARLTIPSGKYLTGTINIAGIKSDGTAAASYIRQFSIKNVAATTSLVGTVNTIGTDEAASTSISITADDTNDSLKVEVTGITSETWRWVAAVDVVEVAYGT